MDDCMNHEIAAIVKPTYGCNLGCVYCYEGGRSDAGQCMSLDTAKNVMTKLALYHGKEQKTRIFWHGGEPLLMGLDFFRAIVQIQQEIGSDYRFVNDIQTNVTLLNEEMLDFFQEHHFSIGTSLDGPQWLHDLTRPYVNGNSSFDDVLHAVGQMHKLDGKRTGHCIGGGAIAILTKPTLSHLDEFYEFYRDSSISLKVNPIFYAGRGSTAREDFGITPNEYGNAMIYLFDRWFYEAEHVIDIDPFDLILGNLLTGDPWGCQFGPACYDEFMAVDPQGNVFPCGRWSSKEPFCLGNLNKNIMEEIRQSPILEAFRKGRQEASLKCQGCEFHNICNSGCVENSYIARHRLSDKDIYCKGYKLIFAHLQRALDEELKGIDRSSVIDPNSDHVVNIRGELIDVEAVKNPALRRVIEIRLFNSRSENWDDWKEKRKIVYEDWKEYKKHDRYSDYGDYKEHRKTYTETKKERHSEYAKYSKHSRAWGYSDHSDHFDHTWQD